MNILKKSLLTPIQLNFELDKKGIIFIASDGTRFEDKIIFEKYQSKWLLQQKIKLKI